jgi:hypothetical protein
MRNRVWTAAGVLVLLAVVGKFYTEPLWAQVRAAFVKNIDERGRIPFQATGSCSGGPGIDVCDVIFSAVPAGKRLVIEHVNVDVDSHLFGILPGLVLFQRVSGGATAVLPVFQRFTSDTLASISDYGSNEAVEIFVEVGESPKLHATGSLGFGVVVNVATISGYLVDLSQ